MAAPVWTATVASTFAVITDLVPFRDYEVIVTALDTCGLESVPAAGAAVRPTCPLVMDSPAFVEDLHLSRSAGADIALTWSPVTQTIQGGALAPSGYVVHAATRADFLADASTVAERVASPGSLLPARIGDGVDLEFFAVAAEAPAGTGGVAHDFPQGVAGLAWRDLDATQRELTWQAVRADIGGETTPIARYDVHASAAGPLTRLDVETLPPALSVASPGAVIDRALGDWHFVVAVDVHGNRSAY